jgi:hypothetical protein
MCGFHSKSREHPTERMCQSLTDMSDLLKPGLHSTHWYGSRSKRLQIDDGEMLQRAVS